MAINGKSKESAASSNPSKENISVCIDFSLLHYLDQYCRQHDRKRSEAVCHAVKLLLSIEEGKDPDYWEQKYSNLDL